MILCLVLSSGAAAPLASGALHTLPWFGEAAELKRQQGLSSWQMEVPSGRRERRDQKSGATCVDKTCLEA